MISGLLFTPNNGADGTLLPVTPSGAAGGITGTPVSTSNSLMNKDFSALLADQGGSWQLPVDNPSGVLFVPPVSPWPGGVQTGEALPLSLAGAGGNTLPASGQTLPAIRLTISTEDGLAQGAVVTSGQSSGNDLGPESDGDTGMTATVAATGTSGVSGLNPVTPAPADPLASQSGQNGSGSAAQASVMLAGTGGSTGATGGQPNGDSRGSGSSQTPTSNASRAVVGSVLTGADTGRTFAEQSADREPQQQAPQRPVAAESAASLLAANGQRRPVPVADSPAGNGDLIRMPASATPVGAPPAGALRDGWLQRLAGLERAAAPALADGIDGGDSSEAMKVLSAVQQLAGSNGRAAASLPVINPVPVPFQSGYPGQQGSWGEAVGRQVMLMSANNLQQAQITLDPPDLGPLQVKVNTQQDQTSIVFTSHHASVRDALEQSIPRLREMFEQQGLNLADVNVGGQEQRQPQSGSADTGSGGETAAGNSQASDGTGATVAAADRGVSEPEAVRLGLIDAYV